MTRFTPARINNIRWSIENNQTSKELMTEMIDYIERQAQRIAELEQERRWIPVSERLPEKQEVLVSYGDGNWVMSAYMYDGKWYDIPYDSPIEPTHWQPLPQPPKSEEE